MKNDIRGREFKPNLRISIDGNISMSKREFAEELKAFLEGRFGFKQIEISPSKEIFEQHKRNGPYYEKEKLSDSIMKGFLADESVGIFVHYNPIVPVEENNNES